MYGRKCILNKVYACVELSCFSMPHIAVQGGVIGLSHDCQV